MKIIVLGANGFIGSNALSYFREKFPETYGCDIYPPGNYDDRFFILDGAHPQFDKLFLQNSFDVCINASGSGSMSFSKENPDEDYRLNAKNVYDILNSISKFNSRCRFLNFSSAAVYGNPGELQLTEKSRTKPVAPHGFHKLISEQICAEYYHLKKIKTCSVRLFSTYGPGQRLDFFRDIHQKAINGEALGLPGTGEEKIDFIHSHDLMIALECIIENSNFESDVVNVASGKAVSVKNVAEEFLRTMHIEKDVFFTGKVNEGDTFYMEADITKLKSYGFNPTVTFEAGLDSYSRWIQPQEIL